TLWCSAAVGACTGADMVAEAGLLTVFVIAGNTLLRPLVNAIDRSPIDERTTEATYEVSLTARERDMPSVREALSEALEAAHYPAGDIETEERGEEMVEIVATLVSTAVDPVEMDALALRLGALPGVSHASWAIRTKD
ncbi:MgtC/SapB family protein, partial [Roseomonas sp. DSM 102946]|nr:MgtC/SapB family protein [Roseomonas sp. DSM 102946]